MKKILLCLAACIVVSITNAQDTNIGISVGYNSLIASVKVNDVSASDSASGFYLGLFAELSINEKFCIQPGALISVTSKDGESGSALLVPVIGKYYFTEKVNLQFGPQFDYILDDESEGIKKFGFGLSTGLGYDISDKFFAAIRYSFGLTNRLENSNLIVDEVNSSDPFFSGLDIKTKINFLQIGFGYKF